MRIITGDDHIINIEKERTPTGISMNKESWVMITRLKTSISDNRGEMLELGMRSLLEAIKRGTQPANHTIRDGVSYSRLHVDLMQLAIQKSILDIELEDGPLCACQQQKQKSHHSHANAPAESHAPQDVPCSA